MSQNGTVVYSVEDDGQFSVCVKFNDEFISQLTKKVWKKHAKGMKIKGFRDGKVSKKQLEKMIGKDKLYSIMFSEAANFEFVKECKEKIIFTDEHEVDVDNNTIKFKAWKEPDVTIGCDLEDVELNIGDKFDVGAYVDGKLRGFVKLHPYLHAKVNDNGDSLCAEPGDMIDIQVDCYKDSTKFVDGSHGSINIRLIENTISPPELYEKLIGTKPKDTFIIITDNIPKAFISDFGDKKMELHIKINHVYTCEEAKLDDDMAITAGYKNLNEWKENIINMAKLIEENFYSMAKKQAVLNYLQKNATIGQIPPKLIEIKAEAFKDSDPDAIVKITEVTKQVLILQAAGIKANIQLDSSKSDDENAHVVLDELVKRAKFNYVDG